MLASPTDIPSLRLPPSSEWPTKAKKLVVFGQDVLWHSRTDGGRHLLGAELEAYRQVGDEELDGILQALHDEGRPLRPHQSLLDLVDEARKASKTTNSDDANKLLCKFIDKYSELPSWVDTDQLQRGQTVFLAYAPVIGATLYYRSLVPGFSIRRIAAVLSATAYLAPPSSREAVQERLLDTGAFLGLCMGGATDSDRNNNNEYDRLEDALMPGNDGWRSALEVRVLHAKVRRTLLQRTGSRKWDTDELGVPINQEDLAATLLSFSVNALIGCELVLGFSISEQEKKDYVALWRYLGWLLGVDTSDQSDVGTSRSARLRPLDPCGPGWINNKPNTLEHSRVMLESIIRHLMIPDDSSVRIAHHLLNVGRPNKASQKIKGANNKTRVVEQVGTGWFHFRALQCRRMIGKPLADALKLPFHPQIRVHLFLSACSFFYFGILGVYTLAALPWSPLRGTLVRFHRRKLVQFVQIWRKSLKDRRNGALAPNSKSSCPFAMVAPPRHSSDSCEAPGFVE